MTDGYERITVRMPGPYRPLMAGLGHGKKSDFIREAIDYFLRERELDAAAKARGFERVQVDFSLSDMKGITQLAAEDGKRPEEIVLDAVSAYAVNNMERVKARALANNIGSPKNC